MQSVAGSTTSDDTIQLGGVDVCDMTEFDDMDSGKYETMNFYVFLFIRDAMAITDIVVVLTCMLLSRNTQIYCENLVRKQTRKKRNSGAKFCAWMT